MPHLVFEVPVMSRRQYSVPRLAVMNSLACRYHRRRQQPACGGNCLGEAMRWSQLPPRDGADQKCHVPVVERFLTPQANMKPTSATMLLSTAHRRLFAVPVLCSSSMIELPTLTSPLRFCDRKQKPLNRTQKRRF